MRILYVLRHDPWGIGGGCFASRNYLEAFCEVFSGSEIDALVCAEYLAHGKAEEFPDVCFRGVGSVACLPSCCLLSQVRCTDFSPQRQSCCIRKSMTCVFLTITVLPALW